MSDELFISDGQCIRAFMKALDKFEGIFEMETNPRDLKRLGKITIILRGVPKGE
ncbi:hypothetical protein LCGC14_1198420 [marine sediment metagenome]|uniref:Uncharacterized protein n=1 Tax=marine sediment metagenome TaxID=412755 RepID=A0A0F9M4Z3_9ZZZZ